MSTSCKHLCATMQAVIMKIGLLYEMAHSTTQSFYRRDLPPECVDFASSEGRRRFKEAMVEGTMENYFIVGPQFSTQADPTYCGLASLVVALNALGVDPQRVWKGVWRWFSEELLDCCAPLDEVRKTGIDMQTFACLARCNGASTTTVHAVDAKHTDGKTSESTPSIASNDGIQLFREEVLRTCRSGTGRVLVACYHRGGLHQTGAGHFSPIGGYHTSTDSLLILDVARFKYPPHWVPLSMLWHAMADYTDPATGKPRGYITLQRHDLTPLLAFRLPSFLSCDATVGATDSCCATPKAACCSSAGSGLRPLLALLGRIRSLAPPATVEEEADAVLKAYAEVVTLECAKPFQFAGLDGKEEKHADTANKILSEMKGMVLFRLLSEAAERFAAYTGRACKGDEILLIMAFLAASCAAAGEPGSELRDALHGVPLLRATLAGEMAEASPDLVNEMQVLALQLREIVLHATPC